MFDANEVINGLYGYVYDENGKQMQETKAFEANVDYDKEEVLQAGKLMKGHKVVAASGAGCERPFYKTFMSVHTLLPTFGILEILIRTDCNSI